MTHFGSKYVENSDVGSFNFGSINYLLEKESWKDVKDPAFEAPLADRLISSS